MKESGPVGGGARRARPPLDPPMCNNLKLGGLLAFHAEIIHIDVAIVRGVIYLVAYKRGEVQS